LEADGVKLKHVSYADEPAVWTLIEMRRGITDAAFSWTMSNLYCDCRPKNQRFLSLFLLFFAGFDSASRFRYIYPLQHNVYS
jgi:hypothetical protein